MNNIVEIKNLSFNSNEALVFDNLELNIKEGSFTTLIGNNNSGKSLLTKIIVGLIKTNSNIKINNILLNEKNIQKIRSLIGYIPSDISDSILTDTVLDELLISAKTNSKEEIEYWLKEFELDQFIYDNPRNLTNGEKQLISIISQILKKPKLIIFDDSFCLLNNLTKDKILKLLKKINKQNKITILNVTSDSEEALYGDTVAIISNGKIIVNDLKEEVLINEKLFKTCNLNIPFMVELSQKLKYYNLVNKVELNMNRLVNKLWK